MDWKDEVYEVVKKIPKGKVITYGDIARRVDVTPRMIGQALHNNPDPKGVPCHRVVDKDGKLASDFAFGGAKEQRRKLVAEGVRFRDGMHVDLFYVTRVNPEHKSKG